MPNTSSDPSRFSAAPLGGEGVIAGWAENVLLDQNQVGFDPASDRVVMAEEKVKVKNERGSGVWLFATPWTV